MLNTAEASAENNDQLQDLQIQGSDYRSGHSLWKEGEKKSNYFYYELASRHFCSQTWNLRFLANQVERNSFREIAIKISRSRKKKALLISKETPTNELPRPDSVGLVAISSRSVLFCSVLSNLGNRTRWIPRGRRRLNAYYQSLFGKQTKRNRFHTLMPRTSSGCTACFILPSPSPRGTNLFKNEIHPGQFPRSSLIGRHQFFRQHVPNF